MCWPAAAGEACGPAVPGVGEAGALWEAGRRLGLPCACGGKSSSAAAHTPALWLSVACYGRSVCAHSPAPALNHSCWQQQCVLRPCGVRADDAPRACMWLPVTHAAERSTKVATILDQAQAENSKCFQHSKCFQAVLQGAAICWESGSVPFTEGMKGVAPFRKIWMKEMHVTP